MMNSGRNAIIMSAIIIGLVFHGLMYAVQPATMAEMFPTRMRYSGVSLGYQVTAIVAGSLAPIIAVRLLQTYKSAVPIAWYLAATAAVSAIAVVPARPRESTWQTSTSPTCMAPPDNMISRHAHRTDPNRHPLSRALCSRQHVAEQWKDPFRQVSTASAARWPGKPRCLPAASGGNAPKRVRTSAGLRAHLGPVGSAREPTGPPSWLLNACRIWLNGCVIQE
jgi:MFS family permease